jgi:hypothetical protein
MIRKFNESVVYDQVQDILNIARDEGYNVNLGETHDNFEKRQGYTHTFTIRYDTTDDYSVVSVPTKQLEPFLKMCQDIETRLEQIVKLDFGIHYKYSGGSVDTTVDKLIDGLLNPFVQQNIKATVDAWGIEVRFVHCVFKLLK